MDINGLILQNKETLKLIYTIVLVSICFIIVLRTNKLFQLSYHQGIRYFRNAFFFYGIAFVFRYLLGRTFSNEIVTGVFEFFVIMAGFFLVYSLLWKNFEYKNKFADSSLLNPRVIIFYCLTLIIVLLDNLWHNYYFMFGVQIVLFAYASIVAYMNYRKVRKKKSFIGMYFMVILLNLIFWTLNFITANFLGWDKHWVVLTYCLNVIIFVLILYGVLRTTRN